MTKKVIVLLVVLLLGLGLWYFFIKPYDFKVRFESTNPQAIIYKSLKDNTKDSSLVNIEEEAYYNIDQEMRLPDSLFLIHWKIKPLNDSLHLVELFAKDQHHSLYQKWKVLFQKTDFTRRIVQLAKTRQEELEAYRKIYKLSRIDTAKVQLPNYVYSEGKSTVRDKAKSMFQSITEPMAYIKENHLKLNGNPFLWIENWDPYSEKIQYQFGFPLSENDKLPENDKVNFASHFELNALHCSFNGDYRYSDAAWYYLWEFAERHHISLEDRVLEIFMNDPHQGGNPLSWKAEVYIPLKTKN